jgi:serine/threonine-protein kinase RsbW
MWQLGPTAMTTLLYLLLDPVEETLEIVNAGHLPPLLIDPAGETTYLEIIGALPLGTSPSEEYRSQTVPFPPGAGLVLYTDGLVERRSESIDAGLERLGRAARLAGGAPTSHADAICDALLGREEQEDDVCVLTVRRIPLGMMFSHSLPADPAELAGLRERLRAWLVEHELGEEAERSTVLAVSEAAANAIEHGYGCDGVGVVTVMVVLDGDRMQVAVRDEGTWRDGASDDDRGRGLAIMRSIMEQLSVERQDGATVVRMEQKLREKASA